MTVESKVIIITETFKMKLVWKTAMYDIKLQIILKFLKNKRSDLELM